MGFEIQIQIKVTMLGLLLKCLYSGKGTIGSTDECTLYKCITSYVEALAHARGDWENNQYSTKFNVNLNTNADDCVQVYMSTTSCVTMIA
jgi:hypothetical protein